MYRSILYILLFLLIVGGWAISEFLVQRRRSSLRGTKRDRGSMLFSLTLGLLGVALAFFFPLLLLPLNISWQGTFWVGLLFAILGIILRWSSILTLGQYFTGSVLIQENHVVVQHGPYKWVRHPSYFGALLLAAGIGLMLGNWLSLLVIGVGAVVGLTYRISVEEQALLKVPGYAEYMTRTKRLIPFLF